MPTKKDMGKALTQIEKVTGEKLTLGRLIWSMRNCDEVSQTEFCKKLAISKQQLCDIEHGRKGISAKQAAIYAHKLGQPVEQFIRLALQDMVDKANLNVVINVAPNKPPKGKANYLLAFGT